MTTPTNANDLLLLLPLLLPVVGALAVAFLPFLNGHGARRATVAATLTLTAAAVAFLLTRPDGSLPLFSLTPTLAILLRLDSVGRLFAAFVSAAFLIVGVYSFAYMRHEQNEKRFYAFYLLTLAALMGLALCGSVMTLFMFYEAMALLSLPLILHAMTREAVAAGVKYLVYSAVGAALILAGIFLLDDYAATLAFVPGGVLDMEKAAGHESTLLIVFFLMVLGFSVKAGMFPLHGWLPAAHAAAPAPAGALLSGVITKAGVLGVLRVVYYLAGPAFLRGTWVQTAWILLALATVFLGGTLAFKEGVFTKRLAYSAMSQVSGILFGLFTLTPQGVTGALLHTVFHAVLMGALALAAGAVIRATGKAGVTELTGVGKRMPATLWCFAIASLGLIGVPPTCGFLSAWYLAQGGLDTAYRWSWVGPAVLLLSAALTAGCLFSIVIRGFFPGSDASREALPKAEPAAAMLVPLIALAALCLALGMFPGALTAFAGSVAAALV